MKFATVAIILILGCYFALSIKKGRSDLIALETKSDSTLSKRVIPAEEEQANNEATFVNLLQGENKTDTLVKNENEAQTGNFTETRIKDEAVSVLPKPEKIIATEDSFKHTENEVAAFIEGWKVDWINSAGEIGDMENYLANYTEDFTSDGVLKEIWQQKKRKNNRKKQWINVQLSDVQVEKIAGNINQLKVSFVQEYKSSNYSDKSRKILVLRHEDSNWLISKENTVD